MTATEPRPRHERTSPVTGRQSIGLFAAVAHVLRHQWMRVRRVWWSAIINGLAQPTLFLLAIGGGIGTQIDDAELARLGTGSYLAWIGPGILAVNAMQISAQEAMWPTMGLLKWQGSYRAILHTPLEVGQLGVAHLTFIAARAVVSATCFLAVLLVAGVAESWWVLGVPVVAALIAFVFAGPIVALSAWLDMDHVFPALQRLIVFPLFIFSGPFFPVDEMPTAVAAVARATPSWHGVQLARDLTAGRLDGDTLGHLVLLAGLAMIGIWLTRLSFVRNVRP